MRKKKELQERLTGLKMSYNNLLDTAEERELTAAETKDRERLEQKILTANAELTEITRVEEEVRARFLSQAHGGDQGDRGVVFGSFGEQLQHVIEAGSPGGRPDARLFNVQNLAASGLNEKVGADGGFLLETAFSTVLLKAGMEKARLASRCNQFPIGPNAASIDLPVVKETSRADGSRFGGIQLYWEDEATERTASKPAFDKLHLQPKKLTGLVYLTEEIAQDSTVLENFVKQAFTSEFAYVIDNVILRGSGAGQPLGILNSGCLVTQDAEALQVAGSLVAENVINMWSRIPAGSETSAVWIANRDIIPQLYTLNLAIGTGGMLLYQPPNGLAGQPLETLMGRPIAWMEQASTLGTVGDIVLADLSRYILSDKGGLKMASSMHVRFLYDEMTLKFTWRVDGQPELGSAVTPANGTATVSPFVALATRS